MKTQINLTEVDSRRVKLFEVRQEYPWCATPENHLVICESVDIRMERWNLEELRDAISEYLEENPV